MSSSSSSFHCVSPLSDYNASSSEFQSCVDYESPIGRSVKNFVASFEHQYRQLETSSPKNPDPRQISGTASRQSVSRLRSSHLRSASEDYSHGLNNHVALSPGAQDVNHDAQEQSMTRSVAELRAVLQKSVRQSLDGDSDVNVERPARLRTREVETGFKPISELKAALKPSVENSNAEAGDVTDSPPIIGSTGPRQRPRPKVFPKPSLKRRQNGIAEVEKSTGSKSIGSNSSQSDCPSSETLDVSYSFDDENGRERCSFDDMSDGLISNCVKSRISCDISTRHGAVDLPSSPDVKPITCPAKIMNDESALFCATDCANDRTTSSDRDDTIVRRHSCRSRQSRDSSRTSSNTSVFGSSTNVDSVLDDELSTCDSIGLSQIDSGINLHETSDESVVTSISPSSTDVASVINENVDEYRLSSSLSGKLCRDHIAGVLSSAFGKDSEELSHIICEWIAYRTALDYIGDLYAEKSDVQRYHVNLMNLCRICSESQIQYLSLESLMEAVRDKIIEKRDELLRAKTDMEADSVNNKLLEDKVSTTVKLKATDSRHFEKFCVYFDDLDKVTQLLLRLSSRLSRIDNSINSLTSANDSQMTSLVSRRNESLQKLEDARLLKSDIDRRSESLTNSLVTSLSDDDCSDFAHLVTERCRISLQRQEINDWLHLADEHIKILSRSCDVLSASSC